MSVWLVAPLAAVVVGWLVGRWRGALIALVTSFAWLAILRLAVAQGPSPSPSWLDMAPAVAILLVTFALATELHRAVAWFQRSHRHHPDTGLVQADSFAEVVEAELDRALRYDRRFSLIYLRSDLLAPGAAQLTAGERHSLGPATAAVLTATLRSVDLVAEVRQGEFAVLVPETGAEAVLTVMRRLEEALPARVVGGLGSAGAVGAVTVAGAGIEAPRLIERARELMLESARDSTRAPRHEILAAP